ncbi:MAG: TolC family protein [Algoriphagus sp.]|jgi:cobalt-zinc-cadmium efflux system outer membrane protein|uniref:TolC family protein n=1 Tax=Algoriphagus sp. TaxID=1872435 RepID=UPI002735BDBA|nr:TolC family protein [Algoriphagus sp.]MDP3200397.1 TolC family protein [Algoriphagus sp.]
MGIKKQGTVAIIILLFSFTAKGQDTLKLSRQQCEAIFLKENLLLIAERLEVPKAEALVLQAKLWSNPVVSIDEVNLWATPKQLNVFGDELQGFNGGNFGRNQQISFSIEQLILTAGKRKKLVALEQVTVDKSKQYFEDLLRNLKIEFRNHLTNLQYLQFSRNVYQSQINSVKQLTQAYQKQVEEGNIPKGEYIRLKALELEFSKNINELNKEINEAQKELKLLMRLPSNVQLVLMEDDYLKNTEPLKLLTLTALLDTAKTVRPDLKIAQLEQRYFSNLYAYEKAQRVPNLTLSGGYDRGGNFMYNFVGFGVAMDLPIFNRNQGNIKFAQIGIEQSKILYDQKILNVENEIALAYQNLVASIQFFESIETDYEKTLDELLNAYTKNFTNRNISLLEYLDFLDAYLENKKIILEAGKDVNEKVEELNYSIGKDVAN